MITTEKDGKVIKNGIESTQIEESHIQTNTCNERKPELRVFVILLKTRSIFAKASDSNKLKRLTL